MEWVVTTGRTVAEAKDAALDELGVDEADAEFEILEEPRQGLFGRQRGEARVRARVRPTAPRPKIDRRDRRRRGREGERAAEEAPKGGIEPGATARPRKLAGPDEEAGGAAGAGAGGVGGAGGRGRARTSRRRSPNGVVGVPVAAGPAGPTPGEPGEEGASRRRRSTKKEPVPPAPVVSTIEESMEMDEEFSLAEQGEVARDFLVGLLERFGTSADVAVAELDDETVEVRVNGPELGLLIGPKGQTLAAVQELARTVVQRRSPTRTGRLLVDVAGYRQRRKEALERFTRQVAADVIATGVQKVLEPMSAADRKVVHDTANEIAGVRTSSEGEDPRRRVVILPESPGTPESPGS